MDARGDQDNQEKSDLQGKIQFYQKFYANQQTVVERKMSKELFDTQRPSNLDLSDATGSNVHGRKDSYQFSTFKSSTDNNLRKGIDEHHTTSLDLGKLTSGHHEIGRNRSEVKTESQSFYHQTDSQQDRNPNVKSRHLDKQSYFFHGHKTEKVVAENNLGIGDIFLPVVNKADDSNIDALEYVKFDKNVKEKFNRTIDDIGNLDLVQVDEEEAAAASDKSIKYMKNRRFSNRNKEKAHRSLESLDKSPDYFGADAKSLDFVAKPRKSFFHKKQQSLDSKKSNDSLNKINKRPGFFQRVGRSLNFLPKSREKASRTLLKENEKTEFPQSGQEKCEYFLQRHEQGMNFFDRTLDLSSKNEDNVTKEVLDFFHNREIGDIDDVCQESKIKLFSIDCNDADINNRVVVTSVDELLNQKLVLNSQVSQICSDLFRQKGDVLNSDNKDKETNYLTSSEIQFVDQGASVVTHDTTSGNKDSLEIGYSISQHGRFYLQNLQSNNHSDGLKLREIIDAEKRQHYVDWLARKDLDALSQGTNSSDSLGNNKPQGNMDILKGILMDLFVCICI